MADDDLERYARLALARAGVAVSEDDLGRLIPILASQQPRAFPPRESEPALVHAVRRWDAS